jgi:CRISPR/Cas system-associated exonuclease Cas4 (RecB family)
MDEQIAASTEKSTYTIKKGSHSSSNSIFKRVQTSTMRVEVVFDSTAVYKTVNPGNQGDINKLYGLSDCSSNHHSNSARFGWRWYNNRLEIHAYTYKNKIRESKYIDYVELGKPYTYEIKLEDEKYVFTVNDKKVVLPRSCSGLAEGYKLFPYFGGDETAPHDIKVIVRDL